MILEFQINSVINKVCFNYFGIIYIMNQNFSVATSGQRDKVMTCEQFNQVVEAILSGKYSWACVLILRFAGYNPLHYIPYRTYNRLVKDHSPQYKSSASKKTQKHSSKSPTARSSRQLKDLSYLEELNTASAQINGGNRVSWLERYFGFN